MIVKKIFWVFIFLAAFLTVNMNAASGAINRKTVNPQQQLEKADASMNSLLASSKEMKQRQKWLNCIRRYEVIFEKYPQSEQAPQAMFHAGVLYRKLYKYSAVGEDLDKALSLFDKFLEKYKTQQLADDAQFQKGEIYYREKNDPARAYLEFVKLDVNYPSGDMKAKAREMMDELSVKLGKKKEAAPEMPSGSTAELTTVKNIRSWATPTYARIVIDVDAPVNYTSDLVKEEETQGKPRRLYVELEKCRVVGNVEPSIPIKDGLLKAASTGPHKQDSVRIALDMGSVGEYKIFSLYDPFRIVIDVQASAAEKESKKEAQTLTQVQTPEVTQPQVSTQPQPLPSTQAQPQTLEQAQAPEQTQAQVQNQAQTPIQTPTQTIIPSGSRTARRGIFKPGGAEQDVSLARQLGLSVKRIVIDPGHGGKDPGTQIDGDIQEKDITLDIAKRLAASIQKTVGCEVLLTRDKDVFVPLDERTAFANINKADLFISIHVNAHKRSNVYGLETYFLNMATDENAVMVAARENATSEKNISDLQSILNDLMLNTKISESSKLAYRVQNGVMTGIKKTYKVNKSLGVKQAPFYVLIGAEMPAILIETGFITNAAERKRLMSNGYKNLLADGIASGINLYIKSIEQAYNIQGR
jgi:N-acetylmuramoyl-L-alanine amidase